MGNGIYWKKSKKTIRLKIQYVSNQRRIFVADWLWCPKRDGTPVCFTFCLVFFFRKSQLQLAGGVFNNILNVTYGSINASELVSCGRFSLRRIQQWPVSWWRHQMEPFPRYWPFVWGIHRSPMNSPHKGQWRWALVFSLICAWINGWVNSREAGDLRRHRAHYDVTLMCVRASVYNINVHQWPTVQCCIVDQGYAVLENKKVPGYWWLFHCGNMRF